MKVEPTLVWREETRLLGMCTVTCLAEDKTMTLWKKFKPFVAKLGLSRDNEFYSVQVYDGGLHLNTFNPESRFTKWAALASDEKEIPEGMKELLIPAGKYLTFNHVGTVIDFSNLMRKLHSDWLPQSGYDLDARPHFEILKDQYLGPMDSRSEEEVWIPIK